MKHRTARALAMHPLCLAALAASWGLVYRCAYQPRASGDAGRAILLACGVAMAYLLAIGSRVGGYVTLAETIDSSWLEPGYSCGEQDIMLGARYGDVLIGALVLRLEPKLVFAGPGLLPRAARTAAAVRAFAAVRVSFAPGLLASSTAAKASVEIS